MQSMIYGNDCNMIQTIRIKGFLPDFGTMFETMYMFTSKGI